MSTPELPAPYRGSPEMTAPWKTAPSSPLADALACACGLITSLLTGILLWSITINSHFALQKLTLWFVIPAGAFLSGWAAASGYFFAYQMYQRRPGRLLLPSVLAASIGTFLLIYYLIYLSFRSALAGLGAEMSFPAFLDLAIRSTTLSIQGILK